MNHYLLWSVDIDGNYRLMARFQDFETAKLIARMLSVRDEYCNCDFYVEVF